jgi:hypothetical protein
MDGFSVTHRNVYVGYLHASVGDRFNVYRRKADEMDEWLGKYRLEEGVKAILRACGHADEPSTVTYPDAARPLCAVCMGTHGTLDALILPSGARSR